MDNSILHLIFSNDYDAHDKSAIINERLTKKLDKAYTDLFELLTDEQKEKFEKYDNASLDEQCETNERYFKRGVKFGVLLLAECMFD